LPGLARLLDAGSAAGATAASALGPDCFPVRAILFDKTGEKNWALGWHQDRTIVVKQQRPVPGFGPWTVKNGLMHVSPPVEILAQMVTLRIHLDPVPPTNAPLLIACGTHRIGMVPEPEVGEAVKRSPVVACLADRGDLWLYRTVILHASAASAEPRRRRVLQIDYGRGRLPGGLEYLGL